MYVGRHRKRGKTEIINKSIHLIHFDQKMNGTQIFAREKMSEMKISEIISISFKFSFFSF